MRVIKNLTGTLLIAGMASMAYAASPQPTNVSGTASVQQQDQTPPKQDETKPAPKPKSDAKPAKPDTRPAPKPGQQQADRNQQPDHNQQADRNQQRDNRQHPAQAQRGRAQASGAHGKIRDNDYQAHFGRPHSFTVRTVVTTTRIVPNQTRFSYGGYSFVFLAPWPAEWVLTDPCYIDYVDGEYVLIDLAHPGMTIALQMAD